MGTTGVMKRVVAISDLHCGSVVGLTPPDWRSPRVFKESRMVQSELWSFYENTIKSLQPIDALLVLGDCIDGSGYRSGGTEQITTDHHEQCDMATYSINVANASKVVMVHGTPYHVGRDGEDYEKNIARDVGAESIGGHEWAEVNGVVFDLKHKIGGSTIPHGRYTQVAKERLWNMLWNEREMAPKADVLLRGHVHYFGYCGGPDWLAITMPALQGPGSKYGVRQCSGVVDFGLLSFDILENGGYTWRPHLLMVKSARPVPVKL